MTNDLESFCLFSVVSMYLSRRIFRACGYLLPLHAHLPLPVGKIIIKYTTCGKVNLFCMQILNKRPVQEMTNDFKNFRAMENRVLQ